MDVILFDKVKETLEGSTDCERARNKEHKKERERGERVVGGSLVLPAAAVSMCCSQRVRFGRVLVCPLRNRLVEHFHIYLLLAPTAPATTDAGTVTDADVGSASATILASSAMIRTSS